MGGHGVGIRNGPLFQAENLDAEQSSLPPRAGNDYSQRSVSAYKSVRCTFGIGSAVRLESALVSPRAGTHPLLRRTRDDTVGSVHESRVGLSSVASQPRPPH